MQDAYSAMVLAEPPTVLGRRLVPFSLGHAHILEAVGSPFLGNGGASLSDLIVAALICSRPAFSMERFTITLGPELEKECTAWGKKQRNADFDGDARKFAEYVSAHTHAPRRWGAGGSTLRIPWTLALYWRVSGGVVSAEMERHVWNMPVPFAVAYASAASATAGDDSLMSDDELEAARKLKAMEANGTSGN